MDSSRGAVVSLEKLHILDKYSIFVIAYSHGKVFFDLVA